MVARLERYERRHRTDRVAQVLAEVEAELTLPEFPKALAYLWRAYLRLRRRAPGGFSGPQPVSWLEIDAFARRSGLALAPWEIELIEALDNIYLSPDPVPVAPEGQTVKVAAAASDPAGVKSVLSSVGKGRRVVKRGKGATDG